MDARRKYLHPDDVDVRLWSSINKLYVAAKAGNEQARLQLAQMDRFAWDPTRCGIPTRVKAIRMLHISCRHSSCQRGFTVLGIVRTLNAFTSTLRVLVIHYNVKDLDWTTFATQIANEIDRRALTFSLDTLEVQSVHVHNHIIYATRHTLKHLILSSQYESTYPFCIKCPALKLLSCRSNGFNAEELFPKLVLVRILYTAHIVTGASYPGQTDTLIKLLKRVEHETCEYKVARILVAYMENHESVYLEGDFPRNRSTRRLYMSCNLRRLGRADIEPIDAIPDVCIRSFKIIITHCTLKVRVGLYGKYTTY
jgi:hypothetical protein